MNTDRVLAIVAQYLIGFAFLLAGACLPNNSSQAGSSESTRADRISLEEFLALAARTDTLILDVRTRDDYILGHIPNAVSIPLDTIPIRWNDALQHKGTVVAYCS